MNNIINPCFSIPIGKYYINPSKYKDLLDNVIKKTSIVEHPSINNGINFSYFIDLYPVFSLSLTISGNIFSTTYTDLYNPELDAGVLEAGLPYSITDPATGQLVTFGSKDQYDQFVQANNAALSS